MKIEADGLTFIAQGLNRGANIFIQIVDGASNAKIEQTRYTPHLSGDRAEVSLPVEDGNGATILAVLSCRDMSY